MKLFEIHYKHRYIIDGNIEPWSNVRKYQIPAKNLYNALVRFGQNYNQDRSEIDIIDIMLELEN